jgi:DNA mismatch repair protein MutL
MSRGHDRNYYKDVSQPPSDLSADQPKDRAPDLSKDSVAGGAANSPQRRRIKVLSALVANQIAAGEVVERPASVVKELVENALDAGCTRVTLEIEQGGIELIRVTDDGCGMPEEQLGLALTPHATSKISETADLDKIATLGFRGEALASIASVSRLSIRSRTAEMVGAALIEVEGTTVASPKPVGGPVGTCVTVKNLFFNTPARRKFLRTIATEQERCMDAFRQIALAHPGVGFNATADGRSLLSVPPDQTPRQRALSVLGKEFDTQLLDVHADAFDDSRGVTLWGLAGLPSIARGSNKHQYIFINGRPIRDRAIQHAVSEAYRGLIEPTRYPTILLMLEMSAAGVDVNVHPQKTEVRFRDGSAIHSVVLHSVREALRRADLTPAYSSLAAAQRGGNATGYAGVMGPPRGGDDGNEHNISLPQEFPGSGLASNGNVTPADGPLAIRQFVEFLRSPQQTAAPKLSYDGLRSAVEAPGGPALVDNRPKSPVLQVHNSYLVTQDEGGVVIIDQHALHERVMFEYLLARVFGDNAPGLEQQRLLAPAVVQATPGQIEALPSLVTLLTKAGIDAEQSGPGSIAVHAFPNFLFDRGVDPIDFMSELLEKAESAAFIADLKRGGEQALRDVLDMMSCKAAVKAGDHMSDLELGELVKLRSQVERSSNCPHGRPTSIKLSIKELEKLFGRA